jgi:hypothetical protein
MLAYVTGTVNQVLLLRNENRAEDFGVIKLSQTFRFNLGSITRLKKSGFRPYATPPKRLRFFETMVRDQEDGGSIPLAPTISFAINNLQPCEEARSAWS